MKGEDVIVIITYGTGILGVLFIFVRAGIRNYIKNG